jgi:hypothetical protein
MNLEREKVTLHDEVFAKTIIKGGLKEYYTFLNSEDNHGFPEILGVFIQDKGGPIQEGGVPSSLLEPDRIKGLFEGSLVELARDANFPWLRRAANGAFDPLRGRTVRSLFQASYVITLLDGRASRARYRCLMIVSS